MSELDVEALLDSTAATSTEQTGSSTKPRDDSDRHRSERNERRDRDRLREPSRDRKHRNRSAEVDEDAKPPGSEHGSAQGSQKSRRRSRSRDADRRNSRRHRDAPHDNGDYYRGGGRPRSRSRSAGRYYRPRGGDRRERDERDDRRLGGERRRSRSPKGGKGSRDGTPPLTEDERDKRTVFVQQLAARLRSKELIAFFEKVGPVKEAQIVKDRVSGRSKGYVFVPFLTYRVENDANCFCCLVLVMSNSRTRSLLLQPFSLPARNS